MSSSGDDDETGLGELVVRGGDRLMSTASVACDSRGFVVVDVVVDSESRYFGEGRIGEGRLWISNEEENGEGLR